MRERMITSDDILGKEAVDPDGQVLGIVMKLHIDKAKKTMTGITIDQGFMKPDLFIGIRHVRTFGVDSVFLTLAPTSKYKGMEVISSTGKTLGIVRDVNASRNKIEEIIVSKKGIGLTGNVFLIPASDIKEIGESVVLREGVKF